MSVAAASASTLRSAFWPQAVVLQHGPEPPLLANDRDRGAPHGAAPSTPPGIRVAYHGGSTGLSFCGGMESGETERVEVVVAQRLLDRRVS